MGRPLSVQQSRVLRLVADGYTDKEIAQHCGLSVRTIQCHLRTLCRTIGCKNRVQLTRYAVAIGVVPPEWSRGDAD